MPPGDLAALLAQLADPRGCRIVLWPASPLAGVPPPYRLALDLDGLVELGDPRERCGDVRRVCEHHGLRALTPVALDLDERVAEPMRLALLRLDRSEALMRPARAVAIHSGRDGIASEHDLTPRLRRLPGAAGAGWAGRPARPIPCRRSGRRIAGQVSGRFLWRASAPPRGRRPAPATAARPRAEAAPAAPASG